MKTDTGGPAFPPSQEGDGWDGKTLLDWFAGQALAGFVGSNRQIETSGGKVIDPDYKYLSEWCYHQAQAMISEKRKLEKL